MKIDLISLVSTKGSGKVNEDIAKFVGQSAYVLDGATGLNGRNLVGEKSDAYWLVNFWDRYLSQCVNGQDSLRDIVYRGIELSFEEYSLKIGDKKVTKIDYPSAAIAIVRLRDKKLDYFILGDCSVVTKVGDKLTFYMDDKISYLDNSIYKKMKSLNKNKRLNHEEVKSILMTDIISNRLQKNTVGGYWILEFMTEAVDNGIIGEIEVSNGMEVAIMTDGFSAIVDKYHIINTSEAFNEGIEKAIKRLREFENLDKEVKKIPRFKVMDDASCIHIKLVDK
ncbi:MAG: protein phosphatase 2C domain-containing protein [Filifactoraceae bacterium]